MLGFVGTRLRNCLFVTVIAVHGALGAMIPAQGAQDQAAEKIFNSARQAFEEQNYPAASARFREFLDKFAAHKQAPDARYGLALSLLESPQPNYTEARTLLQALANRKDHPDLPLVLYHLGLAGRGLGMADLEIAQTKASEAVQRRAQALLRFQEAAAAFGEALQGFESRAKKSTADAKQLPPDLEWAARARCELAEMLLRLQKTREAQTTTVGFVSDRLLSKSKVRNLGRYYYGLASLLLNEIGPAQRALTTLAPFNDLPYGNHARYLLARTHDLAEERAEAALHYEGVRKDYAATSKSAKGPRPDHVQRATFYLGMLKFADGNFTDALPFFVEFSKLYPDAPLRHEADLRIGMCQVQMQAYAEAIKTLTSLSQRAPGLDDQVLYWLAKAQAGGADPGDVPSYRTALATLQQALLRSQKLNLQAPASLQRRGEIVLEIGDYQQHLKQYKEAATTYDQLLRDKLLPQREEEIALRIVTALHLAGDFDASDRQGKAFQAKFPTSTLLPEVLFRAAQNSYFRTTAKDNAPSTAAIDQELAKAYGETAKLLTSFIEKYPGHAQINMARYTLGLIYYRQGDLDKTKEALTAIPVDERSGDLALALLIVADCNLRQTPINTDGLDALEAGRVEERLKTAVHQLDLFAAGPRHAQTGEALLKLGLAHQRLAALRGDQSDAQRAEKTKSLLAARSAYTKLLLLSRESAKGSPLAPQATLEIAKCLAISNDVKGAIRILKAFNTNDSLRNSSVVPLALLHLATLYRGQNELQNAVELLASCREKYEDSLAKDPERAAWVPLLRYHHGVCLRELGKLPEARAVFELVVKQSPIRQEGIESVLRLGQCLKEEGEKNLETYSKFISDPSKKGDAEATRQQTEGYKKLRAAAEYLEKQAERLKDVPIGADARARMLYEAAWAMRLLAEPEVEAARTALAQELKKKLGPKASKFPPPAVPLDMIPLQPAEKKARDLYQNLIKIYGDSGIATETRFELAELLAQRKEFMAALQLLSDVLDKEPPLDLTDKVRLRIGEIYTFQGNFKGALANFAAVGQKSAMYGHAQYGAAEVNLATNEVPEAIKRLSLFASQPNLQKQPGLTDRALLRLGHAHGRAKNWEESRKAHTRVLTEFPSSPWVDEARFGLGFAQQQLKQTQQALDSYAQVAGRTFTELAAKAQLHIGLCKLEQKKHAEAITALMEVATTYGFPELSAHALFEAAGAHADAKQPQDAVRLYERIVRDYPGSIWAKAAEVKLKKG